MKQISNDFFTPSPSIPSWNRFNVKQIGHLQLFSQVPLQVLQLNIA